MPFSNGEQLRLHFEIFWLLLSYKLEKLITRTTELLPDIAKKSFINGLSRIEFKKKAAYKWLIPYTASAFVVSFWIPIPFLSKKVSDLTVQTAMLIHLFRLFELELKMDLISPLVLSGVGLTGLNLADLSAIEVLEGVVNEFTEEMISGGAALSTLISGCAYIKLLEYYKKA